MANIVVFVELRGGRPTEPSLSALGEARRVANALGATVYALLATGALTPAAIDELPAPLGASGADKVLLCVGPALAGPPVDAVYGRLLDLVAEKLRPRLFLWPAGNVGLELAPSLAVRSGAAFFPRAELDLGAPVAEGAAPTLAVRRFSAGAEGLWSLSLTGGDARVVATVGAGVPGPQTSARPVGETELQLLSPPPDEGRAVEELEATPDAAAAVELASVLVLASGGEREKIAATLTAAAGPGTAVLSDLDGGALADVCPTVVLLVGGRPYPTGLDRLRVAPGAPVILTGGRAQAPSPLVSHLWQVDRAGAVAALEAALRARGEVPG